ncbi:MAG: hypothetical protein OEY95_02050 [Candidatus Bathyarchaeota archaeon]|nr:hypothetical protein [Candidatus Bathyarchaeota archaeon]
MVKNNNPLKKRYAPSPQAKSRSQKHLKHNKILAEYFTKKENVFGIMRYPPITPGNITGLSNFT